MPSKKEIIRHVTRNDHSMSNTEIKRRCAADHGVCVQTNDIWAVRGSYRDRKHMGKAGQTLQRLANDYYDAVGDLKLAVELVHSAAEGPRS